MQIVYDVSSWTQQEKNHIQAAAVKLLSDAGITYDSCKGKNTGIVDIENPSQDPTATLSVSNMLTYMQNRFAELAVLNAEAQAEDAEKELELSNSTLKGLKMSQINNWIDNQIDGIQNMNDAKQYLRTFSKIVARILVATIRFR